MCITAACPDIPPPLIDQLKTGGKLIAPVIRRDIQELVLLEKGEAHLDRRVICEVLYVNRWGIFGKEKPWDRHKLIQLKQKHNFRSSSAHELKK